MQRRRANTRRLRKKTVSFRVSPQMYELIAKEAAAATLSIAEFCRTAAVARTFLEARERGEPYADIKEWQPIYRAVDEARTRFWARRSD
jgi:hypothetical protein